MAGLRLAGPFWGHTAEINNPQTPNHQRFYVPTPRIYLSEKGKIQHRLQCTPNSDVDATDIPYHWRNEAGESPTGKFDGMSWMAIDQWQDPQDVVPSPPWKYIPHLHPRLATDQRHVATSNDDGIGSLFLENGVQMEPETCLVYLSNMKLEPGWYRFGGEGHMVDVQCHSLAEPMKSRLEEPIQRICALIVPAVWGSNRLSQRYPTTWEANLATVLTHRPTPFRYRLGDTGGHAKRLSRGRYAVPAGSVYVFKNPLDKSWQDWEETLFPKEGPHMNRWGCGLALPLPDSFVHAPTNAALSSAS
ncbi:type III-B CRISPR module-associated Cmr3 family protein [Vacuolonema iberomarrocanum]|uniref:type III-B CRISPR module-associated Cmr3 family protein n=1 Tax=Vacuolonema iberomarrocanum TaxID=3454632 RepID=UPI003F6DBE1D